MSRFEISDVNPNEQVGGGGCLGNGDSKHEDCVGPYVIFFEASTDSNISPHAVLCKRCAAESFFAIDDFEGGDPEPPLDTAESVQADATIPEV